jgi:GNAT superfamily N-acetyltransferase
MNLEIFEDHPPSDRYSNDLIAQLESYNVKQKPDFVPDYRHFGYFIRNPDGGRVLGGIVGWTWMGSLHIHRLFVDEGLRGQGYGSKLLERAEDLARSQGCFLITVETLSFQNGLPFYLKQGFKVAFEDSGYSLEVSIYFLRKRLD